VNALQSTSGARVQISKNREMYPGTQDRVILISSPSSVDVVVHGLSLVLQKLYGGGDDENEDDKIDVNESTILRLLVPNSSAGIVIGKAGVRIKEISSESGANLKFANKNDMITGIYERVVTVIGNEKQQIDCAKMILKTMYADDERMSKSQYYNPSVNYTRRMDSRHGGYHHSGVGGGRGGHYRNDFAYGGGRGGHYRNDFGGYQRGPPMDRRRSPPSGRFSSHPPDIPHGFDAPPSSDGGEHTMTVQVPGTSHSHK
jgi:RNA-binding protein Nova